MHRVVIVGGGFGGLYAAQALKRAPVDLTLVDRRNFHLFQPLLYQVATGGLSPGDIASPLRWVLRAQRNASVLLGEAVDLDVSNRRLHLSDGEVAYDTLVVAAGARHYYFGNEHWEKHAPGLKTVEDATEIRRRIFLAFEAAEREPDPVHRRAWLTFVIVGAGPTGVELAGALGEIARDTLRRDFRRIAPAEARILLLEGADRVLPPYAPDLSSGAAAALTSLGVTVRTRAMVENVDDRGVTMRCGDHTETVQARTIIWAAGVQASPLGRILSSQTGAALDRSNRIAVEPDLTLRGHPEIFVIGDMARYTHQSEEPLPGVAPVAMQQGRYVAELIQRRLEQQSLPPFRYRDRGSMATIGRGAAVADLGWVRFTGFFAWLTWLFVHLVYLIEFENRLLVLTQWAWNYFTWHRGARLITGEGALPLKISAPSENGVSTNDEGGSARKGS